MSNTAKITKAKLKDDIFLEVEYTEEVIVKGVPTGTRTVAETLTIPVHPDLVQAFSPLAGHLAMICDEVPAKKLIEVLPKYRASGFSLKGDEGSLGVTITGYKTTKYGGFPINTPFQRLESSKYPGISELALVLEACKHEVIEYLFNGKKAPDPQIDMFAPPAAELVEGEPGSQAELDELAKKSNKGKAGSKGKLKAVKKETIPNAEAAEPPAAEKPKRKRPPGGKKKEQTEF